MVRAVLIEEAMAAPSIEREKCTKNSCSRSISRSAKPDEMLVVIGELVQERPNNLDLVEKAGLGDRFNMIESLSVWTCIGMRICCAGCIQCYRSSAIELRTRN